MQLRNNYVTILLGILIFLILSSGVVFSASTNWVKSLGQAAIYNGNQLQARDQALQDAYKKAIKKAVGMYIESTTVVEDMQVVEDKIYSQAKGYINEYKVLDDYIEGSTYNIKIRAKVSAEVQNELENLGFILKTQVGNPRVMLLVEEEDNYDYRENFSIFESKLRSILSEVGFELVDKSTIEKIQNKESTKKVLSGEPEAAVALSEDYGMDVVIYGKIFTEMLGKRRLNSSVMYSMKAYADIKAVTSQNGRIVASLNDSISAYAAGEEIAENEALEKLAAKIKQELVRKVVAGVNKTNGQKGLKLVVLDVGDFSQLTKLKSKIDQLRGVKSIELRNFSNGVAQYDLKVSSATDRLAVELSRLNEFDIKISQLYRNRLEIKLE